MLQVSYDIAVTTIVRSSPSPPKSAVKAGRTLQAKQNGRDQGSGGHAKHVANPAPHHACKKPIPSFSESTPPQLNSVPKSLKALHSKPRGVSTTSQHPSEERDKMHPQRGEVGLFDRDHAQGPANGISDEGSEQIQATTAGSKPVGEQRTVSKERRRGTATQRRNHVRITLNELDGLPQIGGPRANRVTSQARRQGARDKRQNFEIDGQAHVSKELEHFREKPRKLRQVAEHEDRVVNEPQSPERQVTSLIYKQGFLHACPLLPAPPHRIKELKTQPGVGEKPAEKVCTLGSGGRPFFVCSRFTYFLNFTIHWSFGSFLDIH